MIQLYNSMTRQLEEFIPQNPEQVSMYVCGPTVYSAPHVGNARPAVVFDVLRNLLSTKYKVAYASNLTDIDDKIIAAAIAENESIDTITSRAIERYSSDMQQLNVGTPTFQPKATESIGAMIAMISTLIEKGHAYEVNGEVLFWVPSNPHVGLAQHADNALRAGERVEVATHKRDPRDFVLWKPAKPDEPSWDSPWGKGRPGWHIECSAMIRQIFGSTIDIHGGGQDLRFPHHDAECAQSHCAHDAPLARFWMHTGLLTIDGQKMSKSAGNIVLVEELLKKYPGEVIRYFFLQTHYRSPIDLTDAALEQAQANLDLMYEALNVMRTTTTEGRIDGDFLGSNIIKYLSQDLNTPKALQYLHGVAKRTLDHTDYHAGQELTLSMRVLGFRHYWGKVWQQGGVATTDLAREIDFAIHKRQDARDRKDWRAADELRKEIETKYDVEIKDAADSSDWRFRRRARGVVAKPNTPFGY